jgi:hypothetical protein
MRKMDRSVRRQLWSRCCRFAAGTGVRSSGGMHKTTGVRDPAAVFPLPKLRDEAKDRREANHAVAVSAIGLAATGIMVADAAWPDGLA